MLVIFNPVWIMDLFKNLMKSMAAPALQMRMDPQMQSVAHQF